MQEDKATTGHVEEIASDPPPPKPSFGTKVKAHFKKWWWAHLIFFIAVLFIIVLCL